MNNVENSREDSNEMYCFLDMNEIEDEECKILKPLMKENEEVRRHSGVFRFTEIVLGAFDFEIKFVDSTPSSILSC